MEGKNDSGAAIEHSIVKISAETSERTTDLIAVEKKLRIKVNGNEVLTLYCSPTMVKELVVGFFMTEGLIKGQWCIDTVSVSHEADDIIADISAEGSVDTTGGAITSGCAGGRTFSSRKEFPFIEDSFSIKASEISELYKKFQSMSSLYKLTGCVHSAALSDGREILCHAEDIGRHNAVDKVIGSALLDGIDFKAKVMLTSGRITSEVSTKCLKWGIPILCSRAAPTDLALKLAQTGNMTVVGFVRGGRLNVYTVKERVL